jgi:elongator complex protein 4
MLSPALYPPHACQPQHLLQFLHALRAMLRDFAGQLTAMAALPLDLYPRCTGLVRWAELLSDGVVELTPLPYQLVDEPLDRASGGGGGDLPAGGPGDQQPQGILQIHSLPVYHEKGGGGGGALTLGDNLAFTVSRKRFMIRPFRLPPVDGGGGEPQAEGAGDRKPSKQDLEF